MKFKELTDFENNFWRTFTGENRLADVLTHFATEYSDTVDLYKDLFARKVVGERLIGKKIDTDKLLEFVENELSKLVIKQVTHKEKTNTADQEDISIYDIDRLTGTQFEKFMERLLNSNGYSDAQVTGKAGDQGGDILAYDDDEKIIIQAKNYSLNRKVTNSAVQEVLGAIAYYGADKGVVVTNSFFTASAKELASVNSITLWDRRIVTQMLEGYNHAQKQNETKVD